MPFFCWFHVTNERIAKEDIAQQLCVAKRVFRQSLEQNNQQLGRRRRRAADFGFRERLPLTTWKHHAVLIHHGSRIGASMLVLADLDRRCSPISCIRIVRGTFPFSTLIPQA
ncbi:MAG: hypothetical protein ACREBC_30240 [Pyrinomonadaceae bacterium]